MTSRVAPHCRRSARFALAACMQIALTTPNFVDPGNVARHPLQHAIDADLGTYLADPGRARGEKAAVSPP